VIDEAPEVSVVTAFYNRSEAVQSSVQSLLSQTHPSFEVVAVDDGSTDGTAKALQAIGDPRLHVIVQQNTGFTAAITHAIRASRGKFIAIHGAGDISLSRRLERQSELLRIRPDVGVVGCHVDNDDLFGQDPRILASPEGLPFFDTLLTRNLFTHGEVMFRRDLYELVGGYRECFTFAQDRDLWLRISRHADYAIVPEVLYRRRRFDGGVSRDVRKLFRQAFLSDLAVQNARIGMEKGRDLFERYGDDALLRKPPSRRLATRVAWMGARFMATGQTNDGWYLIQAAAGEKLTPYVARMYAVGISHKIKPVWENITLPWLRRRVLKGSQSS